VQAAYESPSLYDVALQLLAREGIAVPADRLQRDWTQPYEASEGVKQAWIKSTATRSSTGICTSWEKSWPISRTPSASGAFAT
jgi:tryptophan 2,3-dioxygenase